MSWRLFTFHSMLTQLRDFFFFFFMNRKHRHASRHAYNLQTAPQVACTHTRTHTRWGSRRAAYPSLIWENNFQILTSSEGLGAAGRHNNLTNLSRRRRSRKDAASSCSPGLLLAHVHVGSLIHWIGFLFGELCSRDSMEGDQLDLSGGGVVSMNGVLAMSAPDLIGAASESVRKHFVTQIFTLAATFKQRDVFKLH